MFGIEDFDKHCMFGNDMYLTADNRSLLNEFCEESGRNHMRFYVHRMTYSNIISKRAKMVICFVLLER
jgi:hypothetical protein